MNEKLFENKIKQHLESRRIYRAGQANIEDPKGWYYKVWGGGFQQAGIPDLIINVNGLFLAVEVKGPSGRPTALQELNIKRINESGGIGIILYPKGFDRFKEMLEVMLNCNSHIAELSALTNALTDTNYVIATD